MVSNKEFKRFITLQQKYGILYNANADLNEKFTKLEAKYEKLIKNFLTDLESISIQGSINEMRNNALAKHKKWKNQLKTKKIGES